MSSSTGADLAFMSVHTLSTSVTANTIIIITDFTIIIMIGKMIKMSIVQVGEFASISHPLPHDIKWVLSLNIRSITSTHYQHRPSRE